MNDTIKHKIRSFVMRAGKVTEGQRKALESALPRFKLDDTQVFDVQRVFDNDNPVWVDLGFGNGESLIHIAQMYPHINFVGMEVHLSGIGHLLIHIEKLGLTNIRIYQQDGTEVLKNCFNENSIDALHIYFPDPWHKKRHHKRRLIQSEFVRSLIAKMKPDAHLHIATDWQQYAEHILEVMDQVSEFKNVEGKNTYTNKPDWRPVTKFERRGQRLGHHSYDMIYHLKK